MTEGIKQTNFSFAGQLDFYRGKVRDIYFFQDDLAMVASDRISALMQFFPERYHLRAKYSIRLLLNS